MTAVVDFASLCQATAEFLNRVDLTQVIPGFVVLAEAKLNNLVKSRRMVSNDLSIPFTANARSVPVPDDMIEPAYMQIGDPSPLEQITLQQVIMLRRTRLRQQGQPLYYAVNGINFELVPTPNSNGTLALDYYARIPPLSATNTTNWLVIKHPDIYLQAVLEVAAQFLKDNDALTVIASKVGDAISGLDRSNEGATFASEKQAGFSLNSPSDNRAAPDQGAAP